MGAARPPARPPTLGARLPRGRRPTPMLLGGRSSADGLARRPPGRTDRMAGTRGATLPPPLTLVMRTLSLRHVRSSALVGHVLAVAYAGHSEATLRHHAAQRTALLGALQEAPRGATAPGARPAESEARR